MEVLNQRSSRRQGAYSAAAAVYSGITLNNSSRINSNPRKRIILAYLVLGLLRLLLAVAFSVVDLRLGKQMRTILILLLLSSRRAFLVLRFLNLPINRRQAFLAAVAGSSVQSQLHQLSVFRS